MVKKIKIEGMHCGHCSASVKQALEAINGVDEAKVNHETGEAEVTLSKDISNEEFKNAIEEIGFDFISAA